MTITSKIVVLDDATEETTKVSHSMVIQEEKEDIQSEQAVAFTFHHLQDAKFSILQDAESKQLLNKWNVDQTLVVKKFRYDQHVELSKPEGVKSFLIDFFNSPAFQQNVKVMLSKHQWSSLTSVDSVSYNPLDATITNMGFF